MVAWGTFDRDKFEVTQGEMSQHKSSKHVSRGFCGACGTALTYVHDKRSNEIDVTLATLDEPAALVPEAHIWVQDKLPWVQIADGRPQFEKFRTG